MCHRFFFHYFFVTQMVSRSQTSTGLSVYVYMVDYIKCLHCQQLFVSKNQFCNVPLTISKNTVFSVPPPSPFHEEDLVSRQFNRLPAQEVPPAVFDTVSIYTGIGFTSLSDGQAKLTRETTLTITINLKRQNDLYPCYISKVANKLTFVLHKKTSSHTENTRDQGCT